MVPNSGAILVDGIYLVVRKPLANIQPHELVSFSLGVNSDTGNKANPKDQELFSHIANRLA
jgi:hypothetical protein